MQVVRIPFEETETAVHELDVCAVVVTAHSGSDDTVKLSPSATAIDTASDGTLTKLIEKGELKGKANSLTTLLGLTGVAATRVVVVGTGEGPISDRRTGFEAAGTAAKSLASSKRDSIAFYMDVAESDATPDTITGALSGFSGQDIYQAKPAMHAPGKILWNAGGPDVCKGESLGTSVNFTKRLVNEPPNMLYPSSFAAAIEEMAQGTNLSVEVWDKTKLEQEKCGALLAVSQGSKQDPRLVIMRHNGGDANGKTLALVGKGVTFDSGGYSLKPGDGMKDMKCDMGGAATVVGAMRTISELNLPVNVIGLVGLVENLVSGDAYKLGDVLTARNGKTVEILNTDAEGRLVLADVLDVAKSEGADHLIDLATLTGACVVALGTDVAGIMSNDDEWTSRVLGAADTCGEMAWQLPMFPHFGELLASKVADIKNVGPRWGGAITAAKFLENFVGDTPWVHIDIAAPAYLDSPKPWVDAGGTGAFVRTLVEVANNYS